MSLRKKAVLVQYAALGYVEAVGGRRFLCVTSRRTGRWVFPKGSADRGEKPWRTAAREAYEEAGVSGTPDETPIGKYQTLRIRGDASLQVDVELYALHIDRIHAAWREKNQRQRQFLTLPEAQAILSQPDMAALCAALDERLGPVSLESSARSVS